MIWEVIFVIECPNCGKKVRDNFEYCRFCASKLNGESPGDFSTDMLNVFRKNDEYLYLFSENGNQVILKADSLGELESMVKDRQYPWDYRNSKNESSLPAEEREDFLKAISMSGDE